jgi:hypothetical protein
MAYYGVIYTREWQLKFNQEATYESLLKGNYYFSSDELAKINSSEGLNFSVYTLDGETTRLAVYGCNDEYTYNTVDPTDQEIANGVPRGWADYTAPYAEGSGPNSAYASVAEKISGVWTASAVLSAKQVVDEESGTTESYNITHKSRIEISAHMPEIPSPMPDSVYTIYGGNTADVDGMYEELVMLSEAFEEYRLKSNSRLLSAGFLDFDYYNDGGRLDWYSPYDLFVDRYYSSVDVAQLVYDFGPKWFFQVQADGSVIVPFSSYYLPPMHNWPGYSFYVGGVGESSGQQVAIYEATEEYPGFPVEISEDGNKIVIKPIDYNGTLLYMNALGFSQDAIMSGTVEIVAPVISEITLTRGWNGTKSNLNNVIPERRSASMMNFDGTAGKAPIVRKIGSMTDFKDVPVREVETVKVVTEESLDAYMTREVARVFGKINR